MMKKSKYRTATKNAEDRQEDTDNALDSFGKIVNLKRNTALYCCLLQKYIATSSKEDKTYG